MMRLIALMLWLLAGAATAEEMRMAVTTSFHNSGLSDILLPAIREETGIDVRLVVVGTGQALRLGEAGDVDAILVHARAAEDAFIAAGFATHRREIMYNDFIIVGPEDDPAGIAVADTAVAALTAIAMAEVPFVSRGDDSGTHKRELALWSEAGIDVESTGPWYRATGAGMGAALNTASGMGAYVLSDRASWLNFGNTAGMAILFEGDPTLFNQYAYLPVNAERNPHVKAQLAARLEEWLVSDTAQDLIAGYEIDGQALFVPNADPEGGQ